MRAIRGDEQVLREPSQGRINQAANQDLNGLLQREGVTQEEARQLRRKLHDGTPTEKARAVERIDLLLAKTPSPRQASRWEARRRRAEARYDRQAWW